MIILDGNSQIRFDDAMFTKAIQFNFLAISLISVLCLGSCTSTAPTKTTQLATTQLLVYHDLSPQKLGVTESEIVETIVRNEISIGTNTNASGHVTCFLSIGHQDPTGEFLARFRDFITPVKPSSKAQEDTNGVFDAEGKNRGFIVFVNEICWLGSESVAVKARNFCSNMGSESVVYMLERIKGKWIIRTRRTETVS